MLLLLLLLLLLLRMLFGAAVVFRFAVLLLGIKAASLRCSVMVVVVVVGTGMQLAAKVVRARHGSVGSVIGIAEIGRAHV